MKEKIKIVYIISTLVNSGPVNVLYNLVKFINKTKFDITIITLSPEDSTHSRWNEFMELNINLKSLNLSRLNGYLWGWIKLKKIINDIKPDLIHTHCFRSNFFSALFLTKYKRCTTVHSDYKKDLTSLYSNFIGQIIFLLNHLSLILIKNNICCSEILANILGERYKYMHFTYINNGIDISIFKPAEKKVLLRKKLNLPTDKKIFIWIGSFIERKNPKLLINTIKNIQKEFLFIMCGDGPLLPEIKNIITQSKNIILTGRIKNILDYLQASDYYISTSKSEGLPMSVMEGMACGLPVILSDIPQHRLLFNGFDIGKIFIQNEKNLIQAINSIIDTKQFDTIKCIMNNFNAQTMAEQYSNKYLEIVKRNGNEH